VSPADIQRIEEAAAALRQTPEIRNVVRDAGMEQVDWDNATKAALEAVIERTLASFVDLGLALAAVRDRELYKETHDTFEAYCRERWGLSRSYAYETMEAAVRVSAVADIDPAAPLPLNPKQATALGPVADDPQAMAEVMHEVGDKPTVAKIAEEAKRHAEAAAERTYLTGPAPDDPAAVEGSGEAAPPRPDPTPPARKPKRGAQRVTNAIDADGDLGDYDAVIAALTPEGAIALARRMQAYADGLVAKAKKQKVAA
jgi:hypothetical protein